MSVVLRSKETKEIVLLCKGADSFVDKLLRDTEDNQTRLEETVHWIEEYAETGLRTLLLAKKEILEKDYLEWNTRWEAATASDGDDRDTLIDVLNAELE